MEENDILREIWDDREAYARRFNHDIDAMMEDLRSREEASGRPVVRSVAEYQAAQAQAQGHSPIPPHPPTEPAWWEVETVKDEFARRFNHDVQAMREALRSFDQPGDQLVG